MPSSSIRTAVASDVAAIAHITQRAYSPYVERIGRMPAPMTARYDVLVAEGGVWVIQLGQRVAAFSSFG